MYNPGTLATYDQGMVCFSWARCLWHMGRGKNIRSLWTGLTHRGTEDFQNMTSYQILRGRSTTTLSRAWDRG